MRTAGILKRVILTENQCFSLSVKNQAGVSIKQTGALKSEYEELFENGGSNSGSSEASRQSQPTRFGEGENKQVLKNLWRRLHDQVLQKYSVQLGDIIACGDIAVVVFEPLECVVPVVQKLGWNGVLPFFRMSNKWRKNLARVLEQDFGDKAAANWLREGRKGRIFL